MICGNIFCLFSILLMRFLTVKRITGFVILLKSSQQAKFSVFPSAAVKILYNLNFENTSVKIKICRNLGL